MKIIFCLLLVICLSACKSQETKPVEKTQPPQNMPPIAIFDDDNDELRTAEEQIVDKKLMMLLREQLAGEMNLDNDDIEYERDVVIEGKDCIVYEADDVEFAVAIDESAIYRLDGGKYIKIYSVE